MEHEEKKTVQDPRKDVKYFLKKAYNFLWKEESLLSYAVFIIIAFVLLRFVAFPAFLYVTNYADVAAVISTSMQHSELTDHTFNEWLRFNGFSEEEVAEWPYLDGLNVGDVIAVRAMPAGEIKPGDIVLFYTDRGQVIHRVMYVKQVGNEFFYTTKGDANPQISTVETDIPYSEIKGELVWKTPYLGYPRVLLSYLIPF
jgi:signal peptidase I